MCGIAGIIQFSLEHNKSILETQLIGMLNLLVHRGPNDYGMEFISNRVALGHRRLSIIDVSTVGKQPMYDDHTGNYIIFNGEIYNYIEIKNELISLGYQFKTSTDTEVALIAYKHWGVDCFNKFNGMWAIAIWDQISQELILSRDRNGIKPLYYFHNKKMMIFASEFKAVVFSMYKLGIPVEFDQKKMDYFLKTGFFSRTNINNHPFKNINTFPINSYMKISINGDFKLAEYWNIVEAANQISEVLEHLNIEDKVELLKDTLIQSIKKHLRSDVPLGISLSGGLDSSSIAAISSRLVPDQLNTYSVDYANYACGEGHFAREINNKFGFKQHMISIEANDLIDDLEHMIWMRDIPNRSHALISMWNVMKSASKDVKVLLSGQGPDELIAGYHYYYKVYLLHLFNKHRNVKPILQALDEIKDKTELYLFEDIEKAVFGGLINQENYQKYYQQYSQPFPIMLKNILYDSTFNSSLPELLMNEDRCSMAFSIESRVPFLDYQFMELCFALDEDVKISHGWTKYILREAMNKDLPHSVCWRKEKKGYNTPFDEWLIKDKRIVEYISNVNKLKINTYTDTQYIFELLSNLGKSVKDQTPLSNTNMFWYAINLEIWLNTFMKNIKNIDCTQIIVPQN